MSEEHRLPTQVQVAQEHAPDVRDEHVEVAPFVQVQVQLEVEHIGVVTADVAEVDHCRANAHHVVLAAGVAEGGQR